MNKNYGVFKARELMERGATRHEIRKAVREGGLLKLRPGWFATDGADSRVARAVMRGGCVSCVSALDLHGIWVPRLAKTHVRLADHARLELGTFGCKPHGANPGVRTAVDDVRTSFSCAVRCLDAEGIVVVMDSLVHQQFARRSHLLSWLADAPKHVQRLVELVDAAEAGTESMVRLRLRSRRIRVRTQVWVTQKKRVDLLVGQRLVIECDSVEYHMSPSAYEADRERDRELTAMGFIVVRLTYRQIHEDWKQIEQDLLQLVRDGRHLWPRKRDQ